MVPFAFLLLTFFVAALDAPTLIAPAPGTTLPRMEADLTWQLPASATQVHLQATPANGDGPSVNLILGAVGSFQVPAPPVWYGLLPDMTYTWRVRASDAAVRIGETDASWGPWSESWTFRTPAASGLTIAPKTPLDTGAFAGAVTWEDSNPGVWYYEVQVSRDPSFGPSAPLYWEIRHGGITNRYEPPALDPGVTYYWRVRPRIQGDGVPAAWSPAARFTTSGYRKITLADNGSAIKLRVDDLLEVDLGTEYQWNTGVDDPRILAPLPAMGARAMPAMYRAEGIGQTALRATGELPCHRARPPCLAPTRLFEVQVRVTARMVRELAPIDSAAVRADAGAYLLDVVQGLPSGCVEPDGHSVTRESDTTVRVTVFNLAPADPGVVCTAIYGMYPSTISLGRDFTPGKTYTVLVNDRTVSFTAQ